MEKIKIDKIEAPESYTNFYMLADLHLGVKSGSEEWRLNMQNYFSEFFIPLLRRTMDKGSFLVILGDIFDDRKNIDIAVNDLAIDIFESLAEIMPVVVINGNHDLYRKSDNSVTSLRSLDNIPNLTIIKNPTDMTMKGKHLMFIPYQGDLERETRLCSENGSCDLIFMHTDINTLHYDNGRDITAGVNITGVKGHIYAGHIHKRQESKRATYVGSPYQMTRSDIGNRKGVYRLTATATGFKKTLYENDYSPEFIKVALSDLVEMTFSDAKDLCKNNYVDILVNGDESKSLNITDLYNTLEQCSPKHIEVKMLPSEELISQDETAHPDMEIKDIIAGLIGAMDTDDERKKRLVVLSEKYEALADADK